MMLCRCLPNMLFGKMLSAGIGMQDLRSESPHHAWLICDTVSSFSTYVPFHNVTLLFILFSFPGTFL